MTFSCSKTNHCCLVLFSPCAEHLGHRNENKDKFWKEKKKREAEWWKWIIFQFFHTNRKCNLTKLMQNEKKKKVYKPDLSRFEGLRLRGLTVIVCSLSCSDNISLSSCGNCLSLHGDPVLMRKFLSQMLKWCLNFGLAALFGWEIDIFHKNFKISNNFYWTVFVCLY